jgi:hypothetical protein
MEKPVGELIESISREEWAQMPDSACKLIEELVRRIDNIEQNMAALLREN